jgi:hypothetical protein
LSTAVERAGILVRERNVSPSRIFLWWSGWKTAAFAPLKAELLDAAVVQPYESTEYQGMVDFHFSAANLSEAKKLADALNGVALHPELVLLCIMSRDGSRRWRGLSLDQRRATHEALKGVVFVITMVICISGDSV